MVGQKCGCMESPNRLNMDIHDWLWTSMIQLYIISIIQLWTSVIWYSKFLTIMHIHKMFNYAYIRISMINGFNRFYISISVVARPICKSSNFQNRMFISFPQFVYCSRDEVYFPQLSCLIASNGGTLHVQHTPVAMHHIHDITKPLMTYVATALWCHVVRGCLGDVSNEDLTIIENNQFTNLIE